jgi:hypothetical protein
MATGTHNATQITNANAKPPVANAANTAGRLVRQYFSGTLAVASTGDAGSIVNLLTVPAGVRCYGGKITVDDTFIGSSGTIGIGITGATTKFASALDIAAAGEDAFGNTVALGQGYVTTAETTIFATTAAAALGNGGTFEGYFDYVRGA